MKSRMIQHISMLLVFLPAVMAAQWIPFAEDTAINQFDHPETVQWSKQFRGRIDHFHPIEMWIASDGREFRGVYRYRSSGDIFLLDGDIENDKAILQEVDHMGKTTAYIKGTVTPESVEGFWWNTDFTKRKPLHLIPAEIVEIKPFTPQFLAMRGQFDGKKYLLCLMKESEEHLEGSVYLEAEKQTYAAYGQCLNRDCTAFNIETVDHDNPFSLKCTLKYQDAVDVTLVRDQRVKMTSQGALIAEYPLHIEAFAGYRGSCDMLYPKIDHTVYTDWMNRAVADFKEEYKAYFDKNLLPEEELNPASRDKIYATAWVDIFYCENKILSGILTIYHSSSDTYQRKPFNFDLEKENVIFPSSILRKSLPFEKIRAQYVEVLKSDLLAGTGPEEKLWLEGQAFEYFTLVKEGIALHTDYHPVFGERFIVIPFEEIREHLRKRSVVMQKMM